MKGESGGKKEYNVEGDNNDNNNNNCMEGRGEEVGNVVGK